MRVGMNINCAYSRNGCHKDMDGMGVYTYNLIKGLSALNEINLLPVFFNPPYQIRGSKESIFRQEAHPFLNPFSPFNIHRSLENKIDIFHSTDFIVPKLKNTPVISTIYDAAIFKGVDIANPKFRKLKNYFLKKHAHYADHIITISHTVVEDIINYWNIDPKKISVIYCGISNDWSVPVSQEKLSQVLKQYKIDRPFLLSVGTIQRKKNYTRVLNAYMQLPKDIQKSVNLVIVGKLGSSSLTEVRKIENLHAKGHIQWLKHIPFEDLRALYQSTLALVFPSLNEGFGLPILEGFASQVPVLTSGCGAMKEVASSAAFFVDPHDVDSIRTGMEKLITQPSLRTDLIAKGLIRVKAFSWGVCAKHVRQVYRLFV